MDPPSGQTKLILYSFLSFAAGVAFTFYLISFGQTQIGIPNIVNSTIITTPRRYIQPSNCSSTNFTIDAHNIVYFYEEFYRYYEINKEWLKKTYLGIKFLQNPNDAITIAEILHDQDVDLVIESGAFEGASALFFASIMYQYRYNAKDKTVRPFRVISIDISPAPKANIERYPLLAEYITFIHDSSASDKAKALVNLTYVEMKPKNVFISLDGDHKAKPVYDELVHYQNYVPNVGNYILTQDTRLSRPWHEYYCIESVFDGPCNGPQEAVNWFLKNEGKGRFSIDPEKEYLFSTHNKGWLKRIAL